MATATARKTTRQQEQNVSEYDPREARRNRPIPLWTDAFTRKTQDMSMEEIGAYVTILMRMWATLDCILPADDRKIATLCRVGLRLWKSHFKPTLYEHLSEIVDRNGNRWVYSERLRTEALFIQRSSLMQHCRRTGENPAKYQKCMEWRVTPDNTADVQGATTVPTAVLTPAPTAVRPTLLPKIGGGGGRARAYTHEAEEREEKRSGLEGGENEAGAQSRKSPDDGLSGLIDLVSQVAEAQGGRLGAPRPSGVKFGCNSDFEEAKIWIAGEPAGLGLTESECVEVVQRDMARRKQAGEAAPDRFSYFTPAMRRTADAKRRPRPDPSPAASPHRGNGRAAAPPSQADFDTIAATIARAAKGSKMEAGRDDEG